MCIARRLKSIAGGDKAVVATTFASLLPLARQAFGAEGIDAVVLSGSAGERAAAVQAFQTKPATRVLLLAVGTDCAGLTLTMANHLFVVDPVLSAAVMAQLVGRVVRQGQQRECTIYHMAVADSVEERIIAMRCARGLEVEAEAEAGAGAGAGAAGGDGDANAASADQLTALELLRLLE